MVKECCQLKNKQKYIKKKNQFKQKQSTQFSINIAKLLFQ